MNTPSCTNISRRDCSGMKTSLRGFFSQTAQASCRYPVDRIGSVVRISSGATLLFVRIKIESQVLGFLFQRIVKELPAFITNYVTFIQVSHKSFGQKLSKSFISRKQSPFTSLYAPSTGYTRVWSKFGWVCDVSPSKGLLGCIENFNHCGSLQLTALYQV